jgi:hypothetical protein
MSASVIQCESSGTVRGDFDLEYVSGSRTASMQMDPNIDDPVNDTGLGLYRSDFQVSREFARMLSVICEEDGALR